MFNPSLVIGSFAAAAIITWYVKHANLSFKALLTLVIGGFTAVLAGISMIQSGATAAQTSMMIGAVAGFVSAVIL